ncbi:hypothetical protein L1049_006548 [Liquidambar formosana]|uniref:Protein argonaute N-terminal domain-containing protein n=1 Tax=Liquidambar formosana TaxID=63359 RepID=A0AAP0RFM1_LIQFO
MISASEAPASQYTGTLGQECSVTANYALVGFPPLIYKYNVSITPRVSKSVNRDVMNQLIHLYGKSDFHRRTAYDGKNNLYTAALLPFKEKKFVICNDGLSRKEIKFDVVIKFSFEVECCTPHQEVFGKKYMQSLNAVFRVGLSAK